MKIAVLVKPVPDTASVIKIAENGKSVVKEGMKFVPSPYDEHAVEQAVQIKEAGDAEVVVVTAGGESCKAIMRIALAMGADSGILINDASLEEASGKAVSLCLAAAIKEFEADIILAGKQAVDDDGSQVAERTAEILGIPHVSVINKLELTEGKATVEREIEGGSYKIEVSLPALFTAQKGLNTPRYPTLPNIMKAKKKEIKELSLEQIGISADRLKSNLEVMDIKPPKAKAGGRILEGDNAQRTAELVQLLHQEAKVI